MHMHEYMNISTRLADRSSGIKMRTHLAGPDVPRLAGLLDGAAITYTTMRDAAAAWTPAIRVKDVSFDSMHNGFGRRRRRWLPAITSTSVGSLFVIVLL
ncbi:hypothetical protein BRADI_4g14637v3 [Brachypodium distachyon]|uniref:Uncharacterized protein n=1 Tax=Brachypodium distachyon TaxID=15368 RepID=A0A0Q3ENY3_BRADI|nr:hypothetical protein BRADI_4g14637v3 [Brachypodium distachyon]